MSFDLSNYTTVNERIMTFYEKYPTGVISTHPAKMIECGSSTFISVVAEVYVEPLARPIWAEAWEPYPGKTPYTRESEMMNAATSAIGRALMQLGIGIDKAGASAEEVKNRAEGRDPAAVQGEKDWRGKKPPQAQKATEKQLAAVKRMMGTIPGPDRVKLIKALVDKDGFEELTQGDIDWFFKTGSAGVIERYKALSDIWADEAENEAADDPWAVENWAGQ